jgi:ATP-binding cassette, subfamily B, bacterial PglK
MALTSIAFGAPLRELRDARSRARSALGVMLRGRSKRRAMLLVLAMMFGALLEVVGIGSIPLFVALLADPARVADFLPGIAPVLASWGTQRLAVTGAAGLALLFIVKNAFMAGLVWAETRLARDVSCDITTRLYADFLNRPYIFHLQQNAADLIRTVDTDVALAVDLLRNAAVAAREGAVLMLVFALLVIVDPLVSIAVILLIGCSALVYYMVVRQALLDRGVVIQQQRGMRLKSMSETLGAIKEVKLFGREEHLAGTVTAQTEVLESSMVYPRVVAALPRLFLELVGVLGIFIVVGAMVALGRDAPAVLPVLALLAAALARLIPAINSVTTAFTHIRSDTAAFVTVTSALKASTPPAGAHDVPSERADAAVLPSISIRNLHYRYPGASAEALVDVSLDIAAGEMVAFVGASGAGKSTLVDIILGLLEPDAGSVKVGGQPLAEVRSAWQRQIGYVPQDIGLLDDTITRNVAFAVPDEAIDPQAVETALEAAGLSSVVAAMRHGSSTVVGARGKRLSGGQRQRIGIARALYHDPQVIVFDEGTSALDRSTEHRVMEAVTALRGPQRTIIVVAHSVAAIRACDRAFVLRDGELIDQGPYPELAARHESLAVAR